MFTVWLGKLSGDGESDMTGPVTVALKFSVSGPPAERLKTICAVRDPRAVGVKPTLNWHDPPDAVRTVVCTQPEKLWMLKSPAFVPVIVGTLVIVTLEVVRLLIITPIGDTNPVVRETVPKDAALGDSATLLLPVHLRFTVDRATSGASENNVEVRSSQRRLRFRLETDADGDGAAKSRDRREAEIRNREIGGVRSRGGCGGDGQSSGRVIG